MNYPGGKNGSGVYQKIISMMPPHSVYVEAFLGSGAILRRKKAADLNIGIDLDKDLLNKSRFDIPNLELINQNSLEFLREFSPNKKTLIYCDPPYLKSVRSTQAKIYKYEMLEEKEHIEMLEILTKINAMVMISGYDSELYNSYLADWRKEQFFTTNRAGNRTIETVWLNFAKPIELHDYSFLGKDFRERERIKRKRERWKQRLLKLDSNEMFALMATIEELKNSDLISS